MLIKLKHNKKLEKQVPDDLALLVFASQYDKKSGQVLCNYTGVPLAFRQSKRCKFRIPEYESNVKGNCDHIISQTLFVSSGYPELFDDFMNLQYIRWRENQQDKGGELTFHAQWVAYGMEIYHGKEAKMKDMLSRLRAGYRIGAYVPRDWLNDGEIEPISFKVLGGRILRMRDFCDRFPQFDEAVSQAIKKYIQKG